MSSSPATERTFQAPTAASSNVRSISFVSAISSPAVEAGYPFVHR
jgi:hypothetical protein